MSKSKKRAKQLIILCQEVLDQYNLLSMYVSMECVISQQLYTLNMHYGYPIISTGTFWYECGYRHLVVKDPNDIGELSAHKWYMHPTINKCTNVDYLNALKIIDVYKVIYEYILIQYTITNVRKLGVN